MTDKYWGTAVIPQANVNYDARFSHFTDGRPRYQADYSDNNPLTVAPGQSAELKTMVFAGAKETNTLTAYEKQYNIPLFDRMIDWGWLWFITKPLFQLMDFIYHQIGNFGVAILITTVIIKLVFFPLASKQYASMANMKRMQPKMTELKEQYGDDRMGLQKAMMELYKKEKINPVAGCWPMLIQIPIFFALYKVLYVTIEMRHAPFFGWIQDLSAPDPTSLFNLFGLLPWTVPSFLMIGAWPIIMGITMWIQMRMNPTPPRQNPGDDLQLDAGRVHLHAGAVPCGPGDLLFLEQLALDPAAVDHHEAPRRQDRAVRQSEGHVRQEEAGFGVEPRQRAFSDLPLREAA